MKWMKATLLLVGLATTSACTNATEDPPAEKTGTESQHMYTLTACTSAAWSAYRDQLGGCSRPNFRDYECMDRAAYDYGQNLRFCYESTYW